MKMTQILVILVIACMVMTWIPVSASAIDPVSTATMANALAQAITAYGASQGVSMTYDVANTDGIGEGVHDLWDDFKEDIQDQNVPTYDSFAVTVWSSLFSKVGDKVAVNLDAQSVSYLDRFWNWLLSGPAEMQKVDDQYYQWSMNSQSGIVEPIIICDFSSYYIDGNEVFYVTSSYSFVDSLNRTWNFSFSSPSYIYMYGSPYPSLIGYSESPCTITRDLIGDSSYHSVTSSSLENYNWYRNSGQSIRSDSGIPLYSSSWSPSGPPSSSITSDMNSLSVQPYVGDAVPQDVYIPDNTDVNYEPIPAQIPLDVNWDDTLFGDGTGTMTDAQSEAATNALDDAITNNPAKTLELADTATPPAPEPGEVYIPLLPVTLPSFNFSFAGIWHYVVTWVQSIGSWLSMMFTVWSNLPYAIVIPVYASAVVVIIIGTLKRFLH